MTNLQYLEKFFKKHHFTGEVKVKYSGVKDDDNMSEITIDGNSINMDDVRFDIDSLLDPDVGEQWVEIHKETGIGFREWMESDNHYMPRNIDTGSIEEYHREIDEMVEELKNVVDKVFTLKDDKGEE